jgi:hypothetical protein
LSWEDEHRWEYEQEEALEQLIKDAFKSQSEDSIRASLRDSGDEYTARANNLLDQARACGHLGFHGASLTLAAAATEVVIRFLVLRPLVEGAFLSDEWAAILSDRITNGRSAEDREMLPAVLRQWKIDVTASKLTDGDQFWETLVNVVWPKRNKFIHGGEPVSEDEARRAIECAEVLRRDILYPISEKLGLTYQTTGKWK